MIFLFLSVVALCASALYGYRMYLSARPAITPESFIEWTEKVSKLTSRLDKLNLSGR